MQRAVRSAKYLAGRGWKVVVLTPSEGGTALKCAPNSGRFEGVEVLSSPYTDRLARIRDTASAFLGSPARPTRTNGGRPSRGWLGRSRAAARQLVAFPDEHIGWLQGGVGTGLERLKQGDVNLIFSTSPPETAHLIASRLHRETGIPWVADFRDPWSFSHLRPRSFWMDSFHRIVERRTLRGASAVVTVSKPWLARLKQLYGPRTYRLIPNGYDPEDQADPAPSADDHKESVLTLVYTGKLHPVEQDPTSLLRAVSEVVKSKSISPNKIRVVFSCYGDPLPDFEGLAKRFELEDVVSSTGPISHAKSIALQRSADVLLLWSWASDRGVVTAKLFEYLAARRNILAIAHPDSQVAQLVSQTNAGRVATTCEEAKRALSDWFDEYERVGRLDEGILNLVEIGE